MTKTDIVTRLLEAKHITAEEAVTLLEQKSWPYIVPMMPTTRHIPMFPQETPYWPQQVWCGGTTNQPLQANYNTAPDISDGL